MAEVRFPNGDVVRFPDGTPEDVIRQVSEAHWLKINLGGGMVEAEPMRTPAMGVPPSQERMGPVAGRSVVGKAPGASSLTTLPGKWAGMIEGGNIDLLHRPSVPHPEGGTSSVLSMSFEEDGREILIPTISPDGRIMSDEEAIEHYHQTGEKLGVFSSPKTATAYAAAVHEQQAGLGSKSEPTLRTQPLTMEEIGGRPHMAPLPGRGRQAAGPLAELPPVQVAGAPPPIEPAAAPEAIELQKAAGKRAEKHPYLSAFQRGLADMAQASAGAQRLLGMPGGERAEEMGTVVREAAPDVEGAGAEWIKDVLEMLPTSTALAATAAPGMTAAAGSLPAFLIAALLQRGGEGIIEGGEQMSRALAEGTSYDEARKRGLKVAVANLGLSGMDAGEFAMAFLPLARWTKPALKVLSKVKLSPQVRNALLSMPAQGAQAILAEAAGLLGTAVLEGEEERIQEWIQQKVAGVDTGLPEAKEERKEAVSKGRLLGAVLGAAGTPVRIAQRMLARGPKKLAEEEVLEPLPSEMFALEKAEMRRPVPEPAEKPPGPPEVPRRPPTPEEPVAQFAEAKKREAAPSEPKIEKPPAEKEAPSAKSTRKETEGRGAAEVPGEPGEAERLRLRDAEKDRLEAEQRAARETQEGREEGVEEEAPKLTKGTIIRHKGTGQEGPYTGVTLKKRGVVLARGPEVEGRVSSIHIPFDQVEVIGEAAAPPATLPTAPAAPPQKPGAVTDEQREEFYKLARQDSERYEADLKRPTGTDQAEAEFFRMRRKFWIDLSEGKTYKEAFDAFDADWRRYAEANNKKVENAPKITRGPRAGQRSIEHRWVNPDKAQNEIPYLAANARRILSEEKRPEKPTPVEKPTVKAVDKKRIAAAKALRSQAKQLAAKAQEAIDQPRKMHTGRYARQAASAIETAHADQALAKTMNAVADKLESGEPTKLAGLKARTQIEELERSLRMGRYDRVRREGEDLSYAEQKDLESGPLGEDDLEYIRFPWPRMWDHNARHITRELGEITDKGKIRKAKQLAAHWRGITEMIGDDNSMELGEAWFDRLQETARILKTDTAGLKEDVARIKRLKRMGIENTEDLRAAAEELIELRAEAKGLSEGKKAELALAGRKIPGFFPTPKSVIERMLDEADIQASDRVLEPSAGKGDIMDAVLERVPELDSYTAEGGLRGVEINPELYKILYDKRQKWSATNVGRGDFLEYEPGVGFDKIVMNPPFEKGQDIDHIRHAYELLEPGGRVVAIMSEGPFSRSDKKATEFREWLDEVEGRSEKLPEKAFMEHELRKTGVVSRLVVIDKPKAEAPAVEKPTEPETPAPEPEKVKPPAKKPDAEHPTTRGHQTPESPGSPAIITVDAHERAKFYHPEDPKKQKLVHATGERHFIQWPDGVFQGNSQAELQNALDPEYRHPGLTRDPSQAQAYLSMTSAESALKRLTEVGNVLRPDLKKPLGVIEVIPDAETRASISKVEHETNVRRSGFTKEQEKWIVEQLKQNWPKIKDDATARLRLQIPGDGIFTMHSGGVADLYSTLTDKAIEKDYPVRKITILPTTPTAPSGQLRRAAGEPGKPETRQPFGIIKPRPLTYSAKAAWNGKDNGIAVGGGWYLNGHFLIPTKAVLESAPKAARDEIKITADKLPRRAPSKAQIEELWKEHGHKDGVRARLRGWGWNPQYPSDQYRPMLETEDSVSIDEFHLSHDQWRFLEDITGFDNVRFDPDNARTVGLWRGDKQVAVASVRASEGRGWNGTVNLEKKTDEVFGDDITENADDMKLIEVAKDPFTTVIDNLRKLGQPRRPLRKLEIPEAVKAEDPKIEKRFQAAKGLQTETKVSEMKRLISGAAIIFRRHYPHIDVRRGAMWALTQDELRTLEAAERAAKPITYIRIREITEGLDDQALDLFSRAVILPDIIKDVEAGLYDTAKEGEGKSLPFGYTHSRFSDNAPETDIANHLDRIERVVAANPHVRRALDRRNRYVRGLTEQLVELEILDADVLEDPRYYHRQVMKYFNLRERQWVGSGSIDVRIHAKGFMKRRVGGTDFNTQYQESELEWASQAAAAIARQRTLNRLDDLANIQGQLKAEARHRNYVNLVGGPENLARVHELQSEIAKLREEMEGGATDVGEILDARENELAQLDPLIPFRTRIAQMKRFLENQAAKGQLPAGPYPDVLGYLAESKVLRGAPEDEVITPDYEDPEPERFWGYLKWLAAHGKEATGTEYENLFGIPLTEADAEAIPPQVPALAFLKAVNEKNRFIKEQLGNDYLTWENLVPEGYVAWQPKQGANVFRALTIEERTMQRILDNEIELDPEHLHTVLAIGGMRPQWVIPEDLAKTLDEFHKYIEDPMDNLFRWAHSTWKQTVLLGPTRAMKYNLNNISGDADIVIAFDPPTMKFFKGAARDLWNYHVKGQRVPKNIQEEIDEAMEFGVIDSGLTLTDIPDISKSGAFRALLNDDPNKFQDLITRYWSNVREFTLWRENILRLAAYRRMKERVLGPEKYKGAGVSRIDEIAPLTGKRRAAKIARDLVGDYGAVSRGGMWLREHLFSFWSWAEINAPRYVRLFKNLQYEEGADPWATGKRVAGVAAKKAGGKVLKGVGRRVLQAHILSGLVWLWNMAFFRDEEREIRHTRRGMHIILGRNDETGEILAIRFEGALFDALKWVGLSDWPNDVEDLATGRADWIDKVVEIPKGAADRLVNAVQPFIKTPFELIGGFSTYPSIFGEGRRGVRPRPIRDRTEHVVRTFGGWAGLDKLYNTVMGKPRRTGNLTGWQKAARWVEPLLVYRTDPREASYWSIRQEASKWAEKNLGKVPPVILHRSKRSETLYYYRKALMWGDQKRATKWLRAYFDAGGTPKGLEQSLSSQHPLYVIPKKYRTAFMMSLSKGDQELLRDALRWYQSWSGKPAL